MLQDTGPIIICDLGLGDSGKGTTVDFLTRELGAKLIVRHNGGPQAAHNVVTPDNISHCFASFGSGMLATGTKALTFLSSKTVISPNAFLNEGEALKQKGITDIFERTYISRNCPIVTPWHAMIGQMLEIERDDRRYGSCGLGVGQAIYDADCGKALLVSDLLLSRSTLLRKLTDIFEAKKKVALAILRRVSNSPVKDRLKERLDYFLTEWPVVDVWGYCFEFIKIMRNHVVYDRDFLKWKTGPIIFEGAQGALLDREYGFSPHITKSKTTHYNATALLIQSDLGVEPHKLGIIRAYGHRHGAGPFPTENKWLGSRLRDELNKENKWQGKFRIGWLDLPALRYGAEINDGVDSLCVTCLDQLSGLKEVKICVSYTYHGRSREVEKYFNLEKGINGVELTGIKRMFEGRDTVAKILSECKPNYISLFGWVLDRQPKTFEDLPDNAKTFLRFLGSSAGLGAPISIVSLGPRSDQKIFVSPHI